MPETIFHPELGLVVQLFEPYSNLSPAVRAEFSSRETPQPAFLDPARGLRLYQGDALELLRRAKSETFDLIFADPPYFLSSGGITCQNGQMVSVDKGDWDKTVTFEQIHAFNLQWLRECHRLLKTDGALWVSGTSHNIFSCGFALQTLGFKILNDIAWHKTNPPPHLACRYFTHAHETLLWARKGPKSKHFFDYASMKRDNGDKQMQSVWKLPAPAKREDFCFLIRKKTCFFWLDQKLIDKIHKEIYNLMRNHAGTAKPIGLAEISTAVTANKYYVNKDADPPSHRTQTRWHPFAHH